ncbi:MAG: glycosyltransferase [Magnetococcales bacterium]|nr:glycosyltransferase [Magnetococcales bacterium]
MKIINIIVMMAISLVTLSLWAWFNQPKVEPLWPNRIVGFAFSPYRADQDPSKELHPTVAQIEEDLKLLSGKVHAIRTYTVRADLARVPELARKYDINVTVGAWLEPDAAANEKEIARLLEVVEGQWHNVVRVILGNETILTAQLTVPEVIAYLDRVRQKLKMPVSTAEPWHVWLSHPELVEHVDFITVHMLPYWEGINADVAVDYIVDKYKMIQKAYPNKKIIIGEVGWPSEGRTRKEAKASPAVEASFLRRFLERARAERYVYYLMEAFDQPWKSTLMERGVGAYWGVYDVERKPKFPFDAPVVNIPEWGVLAAASVIVGLITLSMLLVDSSNLRLRARSFLAFIAFAASSLSVLVVYIYGQQYQTAMSLAIGLLMGIGMAGVILVLFAEAHEWAEAVWIRQRRRTVQLAKVADEDRPMVSIHVPAYNEPPEMMIETLNALANLDYPRFEVLVIDNNTKDPAVWQPVKEHCERLGERFRFFHVDPLKGFKAGALNFALRETAPEAEVIAVIDSDYMVDPRWLRDLVPQFMKEKVAIVQAPQDYRDGRENGFKAMCYAEYRGFFYIGMITRNERNAIIQHGTMTMVRRSVLEEVGGWSEWCITEDAELGLRIFEKGYEAMYMAQSYGLGVMPDTFADFKKQRFRWAYGAVQILRHHWRALVDFSPSSLNWGQRYHFVAGWMPWFADGFNLIFNIFALFWSSLMVWAPLTFDPPMMLFSAFPLVLFIFKMTKHFHLYWQSVKTSFGQAIAAAIAGLALSHTIALAMLIGMGTRNLPFIRTPKLASGHRMLKALFSAREELLVLTAFWVAIWAVIKKVGLDAPDTRIWVLVLLVQSIPYCASLLMAAVSGWPTPAAVAETPKLETTVQDTGKVEEMAAAK